MRPIELVPLMTLRVDVGEALALGATPLGEIRLVPIVGGEFSGEGLAGRILPGGADWQEVRGGGLLEIRARYLLETTGGERIEVRSEGLRHATAEVAARLAAGEELPADAYYFRTAIRLATSAPRLAFLNERLALSHGRRLARSVELSVHCVR